MARALRGRRSTGVPPRPSEAEDARRSVLGWVPKSPTEPERPPRKDFAPKRTAPNANGQERCPKGNGGRHCCQPPLRRAKDLPVFVTWSRTRRLRPALDPGSPAQASLPIRQLPLERSQTDLPDCAARRFAGHSIHPACSDPDPKTESSQNHPMFHGPSWDNLSCVPLCSPKFRRTPGAASRDRKIVSSGASYRPAPKRTRKLFPLPAGGDRTFGHLPHRLAVAGFLERPGPPSRSPKHHARSPELRKRNMR